MKLFLSYKWEDRAYLNGFAGLIQNPTNKYRHIGVHERANLEGEPETVWKPEIRKLLNSCEAFICLIGKDTQNASGVKYELEVAISKKLPIILVRIPKTDGGLPHIIKNYNIIDWNAKEVNDEISRKMSKK
ncbi:MAG: TIR domain-containing protein [Promethearchaeota archaeon]